VIVDLPAVPVTAQREDQPRPPNQLDRITEFSTLIIRDLQVIAGTVGVLVMAGPIMRLAFRPPPDQE
jgi:hypothetical protein